MIKDSSVRFTPLWWIMCAPTSTTARVLLTSSCRQSNTKCIFNSSSQLTAIFCACNERDCVCWALSDAETRETHAHCRAWTHPVWTQMEDWSCCSRSRYVLSRHSLSCTYPHNLKGVFKAFALSQKPVLLHWQSEWTPGWLVWVGVGPVALTLCTDQLVESLFQAFEESIKVWQWKATIWNEPVIHFTRGQHNTVP